MTGNTSRRGRAAQEPSGGEQPASVKAFAVKLLAARKAAKLSQVELHKLSGISQPHISQLELGNLEPRLTTIMSLAEALHLNPSDLLPQKLLDRQLGNITISDDRVNPNAEKSPLLIKGIRGIGKYNPAHTINLSKPGNTWERVKKEMIQEIGSDIFDQGFSDVVFEYISNNTVVFSTARSAQVEVLMKDYSDVILLKWKKWDKSVEGVSFRYRLLRNRSEKSVKP